MLGAGHSRRNTFMKRTLIGLGGLAALALLSTSTLAADHKVMISDFKFSPASLSVAAGDTVTFTNQDSAPHTATSDAFDTGTLQSGQSATVTVPAGKHGYKCRFHSSMKGSVNAG